MESVAKRRKIAGRSIQPSGGGNDWQIVHYVAGPYGPRPVLARAEEKKLTHAYYRGDAEAGKILILSVAPFVLTLTKRYRPLLGLTESDLAQESHLLEIKALAKRKFDPRRGRLITWISQQIHWNLLRRIGNESRRNHVYGISIDEVSESCMISLPDHPTAVCEKDCRKRWRRRIMNHVAHMPITWQQVFWGRVAGSRLTEIARDKNIFPQGVSGERVRQIEAAALRFLLDRLAKLRRRSAAPDLP